MIVWIIYKVCLCLIDIEDKIKELVKLKNDLKNKENNENINKDDLSENNEEENEKLIQKKYNELIKSIKIKNIVVLVIGFLVTIICFLYLVSFFGIYTGTNLKLLRPTIFH